MKIVLHLQIVDYAWMILINNVELLSECVTQTMPYQARSHVAVCPLDSQSKSAHASMSNEVCSGYSICSVGKSWSSTVVVAMTLIGHVVCWSSFYGHVASHQCWKRCPWIRMQRDERKLQVVTCSRKRDKWGNVYRKLKERRERDALGLDVGSKRLFHASLCGFPNWAIKVKTIMTETFFVYW